MNLKTIVLATAFALSGTPHLRKLELLGTDQS
jgi:hypothetical protein